MALTDVTIKNAKPKDRPYKLYDSQGLYLIITPSGRKWWRFNYLLNKKQKTISLGVYPDVTLKDARKKRDEAKKLLSQHIDPSKERRVSMSSDVLFGELTKEWYEKRKEVWVKRHAESVEQRIKTVDGHDRLSQKWSFKGEPPRWSSWEKRL